ncbi:hypothetical protein HUB94_11835 [Paenibacillus cellulosilyticus]|nr:hypothetical protein HUB94_11835 [Paenibacillus cellulosilyticus]
MKQCTECSKSLCEDCSHADYPAYCWSCGYEHEQKQIEDEKSFEFPAFLEHKVVYYVLRKAFSAAGASLICTLACSLVLSMLAGAGAFLYGSYIGIAILLITSTYGVACSVLVDLIAQYASFAQKRGAQGILYALGGLLFPYLTDTYRDSELFIYWIVGGGTALIYFLLETARLDKRLVISVGMLSLFLLVPVIGKYFDIVKYVLF